jgi:hypothetical protein
VQSVLTPADENSDPTCKALVADDHAMRMITIACPMTLLMEYRIYDIHSLGHILDNAHRTALTGEETVLSSHLTADKLAAWHCAFSQRPWCYCHCMSS